MNRYSSMKTLKMYILVNSNLKMSKGKTCSQVGHVVSAVTEEMIKNDFITWKKYKNSGCPKIVLKTDEQTMLKTIGWYSNRLKPVWCLHIRDMGLTEVMSGSLTALAFNPLEEKMVPEYIKELKLL